MSKMNKSKKNILPIIAFVVLLLLLIISIGFIFQWRDWANLPGNLLILVVLNLNILLLFVLGLLILRNLIKLYFERRGNVIGAKFRTKLVLTFVGLSLIPAILLFIVASNLLNKSIESWFNVHNEEYLTRSLHVAQVYYTASIGKVFSTARAISEDVTRSSLLNPNKISELNNILIKYIFSSEMGTIKVLDSNKREIASIQNPSIAKAHLIGPFDELLEKGFKGIEYSIILRSGEGHLIEGIVPIHSESSRKVTGAILFNYYDKFGLMDEITYIKNAFEEYQRRKVFKRPLKMTYMVTFLLMTLSIVFSATWFGFYLARSITVPIQKLAEGTKKIASGDLDYKVEVEAKDEIGMLVESFNNMTNDLNRALSGLRHSNMELDRRRRHIETILSNITSGVLTLDTGGFITTINPAAEGILDVQSAQILNSPYQEIFNSDGLVPLKEMIDKKTKENKKDIFGERIQIYLHGQIKTLLISIITLHDFAQISNGGNRGLLIVFDDLTQLIKIQKVATWQEVARRLAHEIKNPLTPIQLSAQRLWKRFQNLPREESEIVKECTETIIQEVQGLKTLIDEFAKFARMPEPELKADYLNSLITQTVSLYKQSHTDCEIETSFDGDIPPVMMDKDQIKRLIINLLDNAYEAITDDRKIHITTAFDTIEGLAYVQIRDWGIGIRKEDKEKLLEPYFSRKKGGTGLGLAIVNRIISEHHGSLIIEDNNPRGTVVSFFIPLA